MPLPLVVVEVPAPDRAAAEASALIEACTAGLGGGRCELTQSRNLESVTAIAIVSWRDGERLSALVEVARLREPAEVWRSEELRFKSEDQRLERFRTLGLAIAALFRQGLPELSNESTSGREEGVPLGDLGPAALAKGRPAIAPHTGPKPQPEPNQLQSQAVFPEQAPNEHERGTPSARRLAEAWGSVGAHTYYDPTLQAWHSGGQLALGLGSSAFPGFMSGFGSYAVGRGSAGVSLSWGTLGLGPGLRLPLSSSFELRGVARFLLVNVSGRASELGVTSRESVWIPGAGFGLELRLHASDRLGATLGAELQRFPGTVPVHVHDQPTGTVGKTAVGITLALELRVVGSGSAHR